MALAVGDRADRHVGQRNITVVNASSPATVQIPIHLGCGVPPGAAVVEVLPVKAISVSWVSVLEGNERSLCAMHLPLRKLLV